MNTSAEIELLDLIEASFAGRLPIQKGTKAPADTHYYEWASRDSPEGGIGGVFKSKKLRKTQVVGHAQVETKCTDGRRTDRQNEHAGEIEVLVPGPG